MALEWPYILTIVVAEVKLPVRVINKDYNGSTGVVIVEVV